MKSTIAEQMTFMPAPGEGVGYWYKRFQQHFKISPNDKHMSAPGMPWIPVTIANVHDGAAQTPKLHNALSHLSQTYPPIEGSIPQYIWNSALTFWFTDNDDAVMFKLALPHL